MITDPQTIQKIKNSGAMVISVNLDELQSKFKGYRNGDNLIIGNKNTKLKNDPPPHIDIPTKIEIKLSSGKGMGVFAIQKILQGEIIETCLLLAIPKNKDLLTDYRFLYPKNTLTEYVIPLGYGCIYNHSNFPNADWLDHPEYRAFNFVAIKDIEIGEEICTYYGGDDYWSTRKHTKLV